jgi:hypothetical protein
MTRIFWTCFVIGLFGLGCGGEDRASDALSDSATVADTGAADVSRDARVEVDASAEALDPPQAFLPPAPEGARWVMTFSEEFSGFALNEDVWRASEGPRRDGFWTPEAVSLDGEGHLVMDVYEREGLLYDGAIDTQGRFEQAYGYFEARMKLHRHDGHWPAFWLMPDDFGDEPGTARDGAEIDIMEKPWAEGATADNVNHALHWDAYAEGADAFHVSKPEGILEGWHTYGLRWSEDEYVFNIDGQEVWRTDAGGVCERPLYLILSDEIACGVWFAAGCVEDGDLPDPWWVDYVRVYALEQQ